MGEGRRFKSEVNIGDKVVLSFRDVEPKDGFLIGVAHGYVARLGPLNVTIVPEPVHKAMGFLESLKHTSYSYSGIFGYSINETAADRQK